MKYVKRGFDMMVRVMCETLKTGQFLRTIKTAQLANVNEIDNM